MRFAVINNDNNQLIINYAIRTVDKKPLVIDTDRGTVIENYRYVQAITPKEKHAHLYLSGMNRAIVKNGIRIRKASREKVNTMLKKYLTNR